MNTDDWKGVTKAPAALKSKFTFRNNIKNFSFQTRPKKFP